jgi:anti-sigma regulatory factor (Ser/Thr protein kinase)
MKIYFPANAWLGTAETFLKRIGTTEPDRLQLESYEGWVNVHPLFLVMTASLASQISASQIDISDFKNKSLDEFHRMGLFRAMGVESPSECEELESAGRFIPITNIKDSDGLSDFLKDMIPLLHLETDQAELIHYLMSELGRNVLEHAYTKYGAFFAAQYYKDSNTIRIGIADNGIGIRASIIRSHAAPDDATAIRLALTPGITGATNREGGTEQNAGAGLFFIKSICLANNNFMVLYSGDTMYKLLKKKGDILQLHADPLEDNHAMTGNLPFWQGTAVGIDITLDSTIEFESVMDSIRDTFADAIRERKRNKQYKKPRFI